MFEHLILLLRNRDMDAGKAFTGVRQVQVLKLVPDVVTIQGDENPGSKPEHTNTDTVNSTFTTVTYK